MSNCLYIFKKGEYKGERCKIRPKQGTYCSKHKNQEKIQNEGELENKLQALEQKRDVKNKVLERIFPLCLNYSIHWDTNIMFCKRTKQPIGIYRCGNIYPLSESDLTFLTAKKVISSPSQYRYDTCFFVRRYYPVQLTSTYINEIARTFNFPYPYVLDPKTFFIYKYNEDDQTFDFYSRYSDLLIGYDSCPIPTRLDFTGIDLSRPCILNSNDNKLLDIVCLYGIPVSETRRAPRKKIVQDKFTLKRQVRSRFYRLENRDTCCICLENCVVYYSTSCERPHPCCRDCWEKNEQNTCPTCRKNLYF